MLSPSIDYPKNAFPHELVEFSAKVEAARDRQGARVAAPRYRFFEGEYYGAQLASLKVRDWQALEGLFAIDDMDRVDIDIANTLHSLWPEPCWEDDPFAAQNADIFDFLADFL